MYQILKIIGKSGSLGRLRLFQAHASLVWHIEAERPERTRGALTHVTMSAASPIVLTNSYSTNRFYTECSCGFCLWLRIQELKQPKETFLAGESAERLWR